MSVLTNKRISAQTITTPLFEQGTAFSPSPMVAATQMHVPSAIHAQKVAGIGSTVWGMDVQSYVPAVNVFETYSEFVFELAVPGISKEDICIDVDYDALVVRTESQLLVNLKGSIKHREFAYGSFFRAIQLPSGVAIEKIKATCENGILFITLPKKGFVTSTLSFN
jgi:HSP20 family protein